MFKTFFQLFDEASDPSVAGIWGSSSGGAAGTPPDGGAGDVGGSTDTAGQQPPAQQQQAAQPAAPATPSAPAQPQFDENKLIEIATKAAMQGVAARQQPQQPTPEQQAAQLAEQRRQLGYVELDAPALGTLLGVDPNDITPDRVAAFNQFTQQIVRQAVTMSAVWAQRQFGSVAQGWQQQQQQQVELQAQQDFFNEFPSLKDERYRDLIVATKDQMLASGQKWPTTQAFVKELGNRVTQMLTKVSGRQPTAAPGSQPVKKMVTGSLGGAPGGGTQHNPNVDPQVVSIWGNKGR